MNRNGIREEAGTSLMIRLAFTWRNSSPRYSPIPTCLSTRSSSANSIGWPPSSSLSLQRSSHLLCHTVPDVIEHMFDDPEGRPSESA